jgi:hypothetical protein
MGSTITLLPHFHKAIATLWRVQQLQGTQQGGQESTRETKTMLLFECFLAFPRMELPPPPPSLHHFQPTTARAYLAGLIEEAAAPTLLEKAKVLIHTAA